MPDVIKNIVRYAGLGVVRRRYNNLRLALFYALAAVYEVLCISTMSATEPSGAPGTVAAAGRWLSGFGILVLMLTLAVMVLRANADRKAEIMTLYRIGSPRCFRVVAPTFELGVVSLVSTLGGVMAYILIAALAGAVGAQPTYVASGVAIILNTGISMLVSVLALVRS